MLQHIRGLKLMSVPKFKLIHDPSHPDNKRNDGCLQTVCMFCTIMSLLVKLRKSLQMAFEDDTPVEDMRPFTAVI